METIRGKQTSFFELAAWNALRNDYSCVHVDLGTGDGRFVRHLAASHPDMLVIGIDACRENLIDASRKAPENCLFVIANAQEIPPACYDLAQHITINFPWGSLLEGLLRSESAVLDQLGKLARPDAQLDVRLNAGALGEAGWSLEQGTAQIRNTLHTAGFRMRAPLPLQAQQLRDYPTSWAKRLAFGRQPHALWMQGIRQKQMQAIEMY